MKRALGICGAAITVFAAYLPGCGNASDTTARQFNPAATAGAGGAAGSSGASGASGASTPAGGYAGSAGAPLIIGPIGGNGGGATTADAGFTYATWDQWDHSPGAINMKQLTVAALTSSTVDTLPCARNAAVGTQDMVTRVLETEADVTDTFNPDLFDTVVRFTTTNAGTGADSLPTAGTAQGVQVLLGVDYSCEDEIVFTFVEDPDAPGGFRVDFEVILDVVQNQ